MENRGVMENRFLNAKQKLLQENKLPKPNKEWIRKFFDFQETKLKRINHQPKLDEASYRTLYHYISYFKNVNKWFEYKPVDEWTATDLKRVYEQLEDGIIKNSKGQPFKDRATYYDKMFKSKPFRMLDLESAAKNIIEYTTYKKEEVSFIAEEDFKKLIYWIPRKDMRLLFWLLWDYGENIEATLQLRKRDFTKQTTEREPEFHLWWRKEILKRSRRERGEVNNFTETYELLKEHLKELKPEDKLFNFTSNAARIIFFKAVNKAEVFTKPNSKRPSLKDLRSGMACHLLKNGCTREEVNNRLGHVPSSKEIDKYINFLAMESNKPKKKISQFKVNALQQELEELKDQIKLERKRHKQETEELKSEIKEYLYESIKDLLPLGHRLTKQN